MSAPFLDTFARPINYLRVSVTDRCNLRCVYCMPAAGIPLLGHAEILSYEEISRIVRVAGERGIHKVRLTGGEPLTRLGLTDLVGLIAALPEIDDISMTTNGLLLSRYAARLAAAGLSRVNVSLDTLRPERFRAMTRLGELENGWEGVEAAEAAGLGPLKFNVVVLRGVNDDELVDLAGLTLAQERHIRFIEVMPLGHSDLWSKDGFVPMREVQSSIERDLGPLEQVGHDDPVVGNGPARYWRLPGARGTIGFISPVSDHFCSGCNRLRLTADGRLRPCLLSDQEIDLRGPLRAGVSDEALAALIAQAVVCKPERHRLVEGLSAPGREMSQIGG
jgi:cyclic pyranopterin phosphate synthase